MKIYTKTGDNGTTGLFGGQRVSKTDPRLEAYGTIDELNAVLGVVQSSIRPTLTLPLELSPLLQQVQIDLFVLGSHLATPYVEETIPKSLPNLRTDAVVWVENIIDYFEATLPPLKNFILPGGSATGSMLHVARTVCRRAERNVIILSETSYIKPEIIIYLNRLSDGLFVLARAVNQAENQPELPWQP